MDPNETTQKLLNQDPFHEVRRKRYKKKEVIPFKAPVLAKPIKPTEQPVQQMKPDTYLDRNLRRPNYIRNNAPDSGANRQFRQFRVVRDNRINQNGNRVIKPPAKNSAVVSTKEPPISNVSTKSSVETSKNLKSTNLPVDSSNAIPPVHTTKTHDSVTSPNSSVGVYSSSLDPVHIPSPVSRPAANVGAIKREVGIVGVRRHTSENTAKVSLLHGGFVSNSSKEQFRSFPAVSKSDQPSESNVSESVPSAPAAARLLNNNNTNNQNNSRPHQHPVNHQKVSQGNKAWKRKSSKKPSATEVGVIGTTKKTTSTSADNSNEVAIEGTQLHDKLPHATALEDPNVIIAAHIRVSETDRSRLTFGSLGIEVDTGYQEATHIKESHDEPLVSDSLSVSSPDSSSDEPSGSKQVEWVDERVQSSGSISQESDATCEQQPTDRLESSSPQNMGDYTDTGLVRHSSPSQPQQGASELPSFSQAYDPQTGYDMSYFRPGTDESLRGQVLQIPQEAFSSHLANSIPASTIPMLQQQAQLAQMYPQVHLQHFIPYRQFIPPVYVPPTMVMPGYSNNPTYSPHPTTASNYLLVPGANSPHVNANGMKYAMPPQYKSLQAANLTGFGNFTSPNGYTLNSPGVVGNPSGLDDPSRLKYKDGSVYIPNPQAETSEHWMNPRDMQSASYYSMTGQTPHAAAYMPSHTGHPSFNAAATQSSHMQFPGLYHPSQPTSIANHPHHMGPNMGGNVGVAPGAPGTQVGGYPQQQPPPPPQLSQLNWTGNF